MKTYLSGLILVLLAFGSIGYVSNASNAPRTNVSSTVSTILSTELITPMTTQPIADSLEMATFGAGCFWCVEAIYELVEGIHHVESG